MQLGENSNNSLYCLLSPGAPENEVATILQPTFQKYEHSLFTVAAGKDWLQHPMQFICLRKWWH